jgi:hypothetical protein
MSGQDSYNLALPPRHIPWLVRAQLLFGGFPNQFGWLFFGFGLVFVWTFGLSADLSSILFALGEVETTRGVVTEVEETNASENDTTIYANYYSFRVERVETEYEGVSYATGYEFSPGQSVVVEYLRRDPNLSRIEGTRRNIFGPWVLCFVLLFPLVGLSFMIFGLKNGFKANRLLVDGKVGLGVLKSKEPTNTRVNEQTVYKLTFEFTDEYGGRYEVVAKTHQSRVLEDEAQERLLYDPHQPTYAVMLDSLPGTPDIDEMGNIQPAGLMRGGLVLIVPLLTLVGHGTALLFLML